MIWKLGSILLASFLSLGYFTTTSEEVLIKNYFPRLFNDSKVYNAFTNDTLSNIDDGSLPTATSISYPSDLPSFTTFGGAEICGNGIDDDGDGIIDEAFPGGVCDDLQLWLKAEEGISLASGNSVDAWADQSDNNYSADADPNATDLPLYDVNAINFNPGVEFDGDYTDDFSDGLHLGSDYIYAEGEGLHVFMIVDPNVDAETDNHCFDFGLAANGGYGMIYSNDDYGMYTNNLVGGTNTELLHNEGDESALIEFEVDFNDFQSFFRNGTELAAIPITISQLTMAEVNESSTYNSGSAGGGQQNLGPVSIGRKSASVFLSNNGGRIFDGHISEVLVFNELMSDTDKEKINSYLAIKYGITLSHDYVNSSGIVIKSVSDGYANNIAGIGEDKCGALLQKQSISQLDDGIVTIALGTLFGTNQGNSNNFSADNSYLIWGNNGAAENANWDGTNYDIPGGDFSGVDRVWKLDEIGDVGQIELFIDPNNGDYDLPTIPAAPISDGNYYILFDDDGNFTNGGSSALELDGLDGESIIIPDASSTYFTFGIKIPIEICNNLIDDDGDGLIDCLDPDCGTPMYVVNTHAAAGVTNPANAIGIPDGVFAELSPSESIVLELADTIDIGTEYSISIGYTNGVYSVEESIDGITFFPNNDSPVSGCCGSETVNFTVTQQARFIRVTHISNFIGANFQLDGITYIGIDCVLSEICDDGIDNDGDGTIDEVCAFLNCDSLAYIFSAPNGSSPSTLQTINTINHPFSLDTISTTGSTLINAAGYRVQDNFIYGINKYNDRLIRIGSDGMPLDLGSVTGLPNLNYNSGDVFSDGYLYVKPFGVNDDIYQIDVTATPPVVINTYQLSRNIAIADFAYSDADNKVYTVGNSGTKYMIDPTTWTVVDIGSIAPNEGYGAVYTSFDGKVFVYGNKTGNIYQVDFGLNGTGSGNMYWVGNGPKVSENDGASCRGVFVTPEICGNDFDDDNDGLLDCADVEDCITPMISNVDLTSPTNCPTLNNGTIVITATGTNLEYSIDNGATFQTNNTFTNISGGQYFIVVRNVVNTCYTFDFTDIDLPNLLCPEICNDGIDNDGDGYIDCYDCDDCTDAISCEDSDGDSIGDICDLDDDNDGILDIEECSALYSLNIGGGAFTDVQGRTWISDAAFITGGNIGAETTSITNLNSSHEIGSTSDAILYASYRDAGDPGSFSISLPIDAGNYTLVFHWADGYFDGGNRSLDINAEGTNLIYSFNPQDTFGLSVAGTLVFTTMVSDGLLNIDFSGSGFPILYGLEVFEECDTDGDGVLNFLDLDSDNDGCPDALEGDGGFTYANITNDTLTGGVDLNGVPNIATGGQEVGSSTDASIQSDECDVCNNISTLFSDNDLDGIGDICDLDDDNDGILDEYECSLAPLLFNSLSTTPDTYTLGEISVTQQFGNIGSINISNTNDNGNLAITGTGAFVDITTTSMVTFIILPANNSGVNFDDGDLWTLSAAGVNFIINDPNSELEIINNIIGSITFRARALFNPTNWSILASGTTNLLVTMNTGNPSSDIRIELQNCLDTDNDGIPDHFDLDSDNDGCFDTEEENVADSDNDGISGTGTPTVDPTGLVNGITYIIPPNDTWQNSAVGPCLSEICDNGLDDDGDGLTDCLDADCTPTASNATLVTCDNSNLTGQGTFFLHDANPIITSESGVIISYHLTNANANSGINPLISPYNSVDATVYVRVERVATGCYATANITLDVGVQCLESCVNGEDEDGDGLIDCEDPDCPCCDGN